MDENRPFGDPVARKVTVIASPTVQLSPKGKQNFNPGDNDEFTLDGYREVWPLFVIAVILCVLTGGFLALAFYWMQHWLLKMTHIRCPLASATRLLIARHNVKEVTSVYIMDIPNRRGLERNTPSSLFYGLKGLSKKEQDLRRFIYGPNFMRVQVTPILILLIREVLSPFYMFQLFSICLWIAEAYYYYAGCLAGLSLLTVVITLYQTRKMQRKLKRLYPIPAILPLQHLFLQCSLIKRRFISVVSSKSCFVNRVSSTVL